MATPATRAVKQVKPLLSRSREEARRRVLNLYRSWYRQVPIMLLHFDIDKSEEECKQKIREEFMRYKDVQDIRLIDQLVIKGQMELKEVVMMWKNKGHLMFYWKETVPKKPTDFMSKFLSGQD